MRLVRVSLFACLLAAGFLMFKSPRATTLPIARKSCIFLPSCWIRTTIRHSVFSRRISTLESVIPTGTSTFRGCAKAE